MGEIGIPRHEFLHDLQWWEVKAIIRGYNARHHAGWEQARFIAYHVRYCMGVGKDEVVPDVQAWRPFPWEKAEIEANLPSDEWVEQQRRELQRLNATNGQ